MAVRGSKQWSPNGYEQVTSVVGFDFPPKRVPQELNGAANRSTGDLLFLGDVGCRDAMTALQHIRNAMKPCEDREDVVEIVGVTHDRGTVKFRGLM